MTSLVTRVTYTPATTTVLLMKTTTRPGGWPSWDLARQTPNCTWTVSRVKTKGSTRVWQRLPCWGRHRPLRSKSVSCWTCFVDVTFCCCVLSYIINVGFLISWIRVVDEIQQIARPLWLMIKHIHNFTIVKASIGKGEYISANDISMN